MQRRMLLAALGAVLSVGLFPAPAGSLVTGTAVRTVGGPGHAGLYAWGATTMLDGSVLIGDYWNMRVLRYGADGTPLGAFVNSPGFGDQQHQAPYGLGTDPVDGSIYLADTDRYKVNKYSSQGAFQFAVGVNGASGVGPGRFRYPSRVAVTPDQTLWVVDTWDNNIVAHTPSGTELFQYGSFGTGIGQFKQPHGIAVDARGWLYVVDTSNHRVQIFESDLGGRRLIPRGSFGTKGTAPGQFAGDMRGIAIDKANGWVYVVDAEGNRVSKFTTAGQFLLRWGSSGSGPGQFSDGGREITVDREGKVWVSDMPNFRVQVFSPTGQYLFERPNPPAPPPDGRFNGPRGVAVDGAGNMFVTDTYNQRIVKLGPDGRHITAWGSRGRDEYAFNYPRMVAVDPRNGDVVVADTDNHRIKKYDNNGTFKWQVGGLGAGNAALFRNPHGVDVAPNGAIVVADTNNDRVVVLAEDGAFVRAFGSSGRSEGQFLFPRGIAWGPDGTIWVADSTRDVVQQFSAAGAYLARVGGPGTTVSTLNNPFDLQVSGDRVIVADTGANMIKVWLTNGTFDGAFGRPGNRLGNLGQPQGIAILGDRLYVAEQRTERVTEWRIAFA